MSRASLVVRLLLLAGVGGLALATQAAPPPRPAAKPSYRLEPVADTRLLMEGLNQANFRGLERLLKQEPASADAWTFARGQALLIAETGNLLLMRPPRNSGEDAWMERASDLRDKAAALGRSAGSHDYEGSRVALTALADSCTRCHQAFRVPVRIVPFAEPAERAAPRGSP